MISSTWWFQVHIPLASSYLQKIYNIRGSLLNVYLKPCRMCTWNPAECVLEISRLPRILYIFCRYEEACGMWFQVHIPQASSQKIDWMPCLLLGISLERALKLLALLRKATCILWHPMDLCSPVQVLWCFQVQIVQMWWFRVRRQQAPLNIQKIPV